MPCLIRHLLISPVTGAGAVPPDRKVGSMAEALGYESEAGVYAVFASWHGHRVVCLSRHIDRLEDSAQRAGFSLTLDRLQLREQLRLMLDDTGFEEAKFRISATPHSDSVMVSAEPYFGPPTDLQLRGVRCGSVTDVTRTNPKAKQTRWIKQRSELGGADLYEQLLVDHSGGILEGASSNFYVIRKNHPGRPAAEVRHQTTVLQAAEDRRQATVLQTAAVGMLPGISRTIVMEVAQQVATVDLTAPLLADADHFAEAFLTSASRGIVPIVEIDGQQIGDGHPGPTTARLIELYNSRARSLEEPL